MTMLPLVSSGDASTVVLSRDDYHRDGGVHGSRLISIEEAEASQLEESGTSNLTYDLRVGCRYRDHRDAYGKKLEEGGTIVLHPQTAVVIETKEVVRFSRSAFGLVVPRVSHLQNGLSITTTKVDPGYEGHLLVTAFNLGKRKAELKSGDRFCCLCAIEAGDGTQPYAKQGKRLPVGPTGRFHLVRDLFDANRTALVAVLLFVNIVLGIIAIITYF